MIKNSHRIALGIVASAALLAVGACGPEDTSEAAPAIVGSSGVDMDQVYMDTLDTVGVPLESHVAIEAGKHSCDLFEAAPGMTSYDVSVKLAADRDLTDYAASSIIGAATVAYCPDYIGR